MFRKMIALLLTLCMLLPQIPLGSLAAEPDPYSGTCGVSLTWRFDPATGTLTISGKGDMTDCYSDTPPPAWEHLKNEIRSVVLEEGVWSVGANAFRSYPALEEVSFPDSLNSIGLAAFYQTRITGDLVLPNVTGIDYAGFKETGITGVELPKAVFIGREAFALCQSLKKVVLPENMKQQNFYSKAPIQEGAFWGCTALESFRMPGDMLFIDNDVLLGCRNLRELTFVGNRLWDLKLKSFCGIGVETLVLPDQMRELGRDSVSELPNCREIVVGEGTKRIFSCFKQCLNLAKVHIPSSVENISNDCFQGSPNAVVVCASDSYAAGWASAQGIRCEYTDGVQGHRITVQDPKGQVLAQGFSVNWYEPGSDTVLATGPVLQNAEPGRAYDVEVILDEASSYLYLPPERFSCSGSGVCRLQKIPKQQLHLDVLDPSGAGIPEAFVTAVCTFNGQYEQTYTRLTTEGGSLYCELPALPVRLTVSQEGYLSESKSFVLDASTADQGEWMLAKLPEDRIQLELTRADPVLPGQIPEEVPLTDISGLAWTVTKNGTDLTEEEFQVQYPDIFLQKGVWDPETEFTVFARDPMGRLMQQSPAPVARNERGASASICFRTPGRLRVENPSRDAGVMLFDETGRLTDASAAAPFYESPALPDGTYTLALTAKSELLQSVPRLALLRDMLTAGSDYRELTVEIQSGEITLVPEPQVPEFPAEKFSFLDPGGTEFTALRRKIAAGQLQTLRLSYAMKPEYARAENQTVSFTLPEGVVLIENSLTVAGRLVPYSVSGQTITVATGTPEERIMLCVTANGEGSQSILAEISFRYNGDLLKQSAGSVRFETTELDVHMPERTASKKISVCGTAMPQQNVRVIFGDSGRSVAVNTDHLGNWYAAVELDRDPIPQSSYPVYATCEANGQTYTSVPRQVVYDPDTVCLQRITMYNTADFGEEVTTLNFDSYFERTPYYRYNPGMSEFTFCLEFDRPVTDQDLQNVYAVIEDQTGTLHYIPAEYRDGVWAGTCSLSAVNATPACVGAVFDEIRGDSIDLEGAGSAEELLAQMPRFDYRHHDTQLSAQQDQDLTRAQDAALASFRTYCTRKLEAEIPPEDDVFSVPLMDPDRNGKLLDAGVEILDPASVDESELAPLGDNFPDWQASCSLTPQEDMTITLLNGKEQFAFSVTAPGSFFTGAPAPVMFAGGVSAVTDATAVLDSINLIFQAINYYKMVDVLQKNRDHYQHYADQVRSLLLARCKNTGDYRLSSGDMEKFDLVLRNLMDAGAQIYQSLAIDLDLFRQSVIKNCFAQAGSIALGKVSNKVISSRVPKFDPDYWDASDFLIEVNRLGVKTTYQAFGTAISAERLLDHGDVSQIWKVLDQTHTTQLSYLDAIAGKIMKSYSSCEEDTDPPGKPERMMPVQVLPDPSGYIYEAVPSNRVEGAKVTCFLDSESSYKQRWNAGDYGQDNPLITDRQGRYMWSVPIGSYYITVEKEGYEKADSREIARYLSSGATDTLPVPPPQTLVDIGLVAQAAPEVRSVQASEDEVQIVFTQYMVPQTVTVTVTAEGAPVSGRLEAVDTEADYWGQNAYASRYRFVPDSVLTGTVTVCVSPEAASYNGQLLGEHPEWEAPVEILPEALTAEPFRVPIGDAGSCRIRVTPAEAGAGKTVLVENGSPSFLSLDASAIWLDDQGTGVVTGCGRLPGAARLILKLEGTDLETALTAEIGIFEPRQELCSGVTFSLEDGAEVKSGTELSLSCETPEAQIYYTTDGSCPCKQDNPGRISYTRPIAITRDVTVIACAEKPGAQQSAPTSVHLTLEAGPAPHTHAFGPWTLTREPTATQPGMETRSCSCGETQTRTVPKYRNPFMDVPVKEYFATPVLWAVDREITNGMTPTTFEPKRTCTRAQIVTFLWRYAGKPEPQGCSTDFTDLNPREYYYQAVLWAVENGITDGFPDGTFRPADPCSRAQVVTFLHRSQGRPSAGTVRNPFPDVSRGWFYEPVLWAVEHGVTDGFPDGSFRPAASCTRGQIVTFLYRSCHESSNQPERPAS